MEASLATSPRQASPEAAPAVPTRIASTPWVLYAVLFSSTCIVVGLIWDISWHMSIGRDSLWSPPHVLEQIGASVAGLACGWLVLKTTFAGSAEQRAQSVRFWGFRGPLGAWICIWGSLAMIGSVPFDNWWHNAYGLDVEILSPPHMVLLAGMMGIQFGAMIMALGAQNRAIDSDARRFGWMYVYAGGVLVVMAAIVATEFIARPNLMHGASFYQITAVIFPLLLLAVARASRLRWPVTMTALVYMGILAVMIWILQLFPATPRLAPIHNPVTRMVPLAFPLLLVIPAFALDLLRHRLGNRRDWVLATAAGVSFVAIMLAVHWFWAEFMLSPAARNFVFAADQWPYMSPLGPWRYEFWTLNTNAAGQWSPLLFTQGLGIALIAAILSSRLGLAWGNGMRRVRR